LGITVSKKVPAKKFSLGTLFLTVIPRGTRGNLFYCTYFYWEPSIQSTSSQNNMVPLGITVSNKVPARIFSLGNFFLIMISLFLTRKIAKPPLLKLKNPDKIMSILS
jgi:hypothetical protein